MTNQRKSKIQLGAALLLCGLALMLCLSLVFIATHAHHDCPGPHHCPICLQISHATVLMRNLLSVGVFMLTSVLSGYIPIVLTLSGSAATWLAGRSRVWMIKPPHTPGMITKAVCKN